MAGYNFLILLLFVFIVVLYIILSIKFLSSIDIIIITLSLIILWSTMYLKSYRITSKEGFVDATTAATAATASTAATATTSATATISSTSRIEEDYSIMAQGCTVYLTVFTKKSYPGSGTDWYNVAYKENNSKCDEGAKVFKISLNNVFNAHKGVTLSSNFITGPLSNNLGISLQNTFTIFIFCLNSGQFQVSTTDSAIPNIELLKLYANSNNNNGLSLYLDPNNIDRSGSDGVTGKLFLEYAGKDGSNDILAVLSNHNSSTNQKFTFTKINPCCFFIVKDIDKVIVYYIAGAIQTTNNIKEVGRIASIPATLLDSTLSNKAMVINRFKNWTGNLFAFGIIDENISLGSMTSIYNHLYQEYENASNPIFASLNNAVQQLTNDINNLTACKFDTVTCNACDSSVGNNWHDVNKIINATTACKTAVNNYCKVNYNNNTFCECWKPNGPFYNTPTCISFRSIFDPSYAVCTSVGPDDLNCIKNRYKLIEATECPKIDSNISCSLSQSSQLVKNTYTDYDFNKLRISSQGAINISKPHKNNRIKKLNTKIDDPEASSSDDEEDVRKHKKLTKDSGFMLGQPLEENVDNPYKKDIMAILPRQGTANALNNINKVVNPYQLYDQEKINVGEGGRSGDAGGSGGTGGSASEGGTSEDLQFNPVDLPTPPKTWYERISGMLNFF